MTKLKWFAGGEERRVKGIYILEQLTQEKNVQSQKLFYHLSRIMRFLTQYYS